MKYLIWGVLLALVMFWLLRPKTQHVPRRKPAAEVDAPEAMLQCADCGMHFPASEALPAPSGQVFCCEEHRRRHASR
jgi:uncharacterized protein